MSLKVRDNKNRWRNKTVAFRMSPEEADQLDTLARLSGHTKQDYLIRRVLKKDVVVNGNPRVFKMLRNQLLDVYSELCRLEQISENQDELLDLIHYIADILSGLKEDE